MASLTYRTKIIHSSDEDGERIEYKIHRVFWPAQAIRTFMADHPDAVVEYSYSDAKGAFAGSRDKAEYRRRSEYEDYIIKNPSSAPKPPAAFDLGGLINEEMRP